MIQDTLKHFEQVVVQEEFLCIPRNLVSLTLIPFHTFLKSHGFELSSGDNAQNANVEQFSMVKQHIRQLTHSTDIHNMSSHIARLIFPEIL